MKQINVVAAVICGTDENKGKIFATQRGYGDFKGGWEFPGGKIELHETPAVALKREIQEELKIEIEVGDLIQIVEYDYSTFHLTMQCFWCRIVSGKITLVEHDAARWLSKNELWSVEWLPADVGVVKELERLQNF